MAQPKPHSADASSTRGPTPSAASHDRLVIGVTGHRHDQLANGDPVRLTEEISDLLAAIRSMYPMRELRLVSSLASGADTILADKALAAGWRLQVVLPAPRAIYARDFDADGRSALERHLDAADAVFELPCEAQVADAVHYERAGHVMLDQSDLVIAVWDGLPGRGRGGTGRTVEEAVARGIPVIHIDTGGGPRTVLWRGFDVLGLGGLEPDTVARGALRDLKAPARDNAEPSSRDTFRDVHGGILAWPYTIFLWLMGVRRIAWADLRLRSGKVRDVATAPAPAGPRVFADVLRDVVEPHFARADREATVMAARYRSGFILNAALSAFAVILALSGLAAPAGLHSILSLTEVLALFAILGVTHLGGKRRWHLRWIEQRHLAERLRGLSLAAQLGDVSAAAAINETAKDRILRQLARAIGLPSARAEAAYLGDVHDALLKVLDDQIGYHTINARRMRLLDHRLHRLGTSLFVLGVVTCLGIPFIEFSMHFGEEIINPLNLAAVMSSAILPAIGAAISGIRTQGDFANVANRASSLAQSLTSLRNGLKPVSDTGTERSFDQLRSAIRRVVILMNAELVEWHAAHSARPLTLPT